MSVISFFKKILSKIGSFFGSLPTEIKTLLSVSVNTVENFKAFIDSPLADIITAIIPGDADDKIKEKLRVILPILITELKNLNRELTWTDLHKLAIDIAEQLLNGTLTKAQMVYAVQLQYDKIKEEIENATVQPKK